MPALASRGSVEAGTGVGLQGEASWWGRGSRHRGCEVLRVFGFFGIHNLFIDKETFLDFYLNDKRL